MYSTFHLFFNVIRLALFNKDMAKTVSDSLSPLRYAKPLYFVYNILILDHILYSNKKITFSFQNQITLNDAARITNRTVIRYCYTINVCVTQKFLFLNSALPTM